MDELYNAKEMPLSVDSQKRSIQEKIIRGEKVSSLELLKLGSRDKVITKIGDYECKSTCCYRAVDIDTLEEYKRVGFISNEFKNEYVPNKNNAGIDWYIGGACPTKYGDIIIEVPAYKYYFTPTLDSGIGMCAPVDVRHMKSSPKVKPIPITLISNIFDYSLIKCENNLELEHTNQKSI